MKNALVLGGTTPHIRLILELKKLGYNVILVDYLDNPPSKEYADKHIKESTLDKDAVLKIANDYKAELVISACIDQTNSICCYVAEKLGLPHPYSYQTSLNVTDKSLMKTLMLSNSIPTSWFAFGSNPSDIDWNSVSFPAVIKPVDCNSSKGVQKVSNIDEAKEFFSKATKISRSGKALIEGFVDGIEIQVDCYATDEEVDIILCRQKKQISRDIKQELNSSGSFFPSNLSSIVQEQIYCAANKISKVFKLRNTPFFFQAIVNKEDELFILEFAPRIGGGLSFYILKDIVGFDPIKAIIDSYFGITYKYSLNKLIEKYSTTLLYMDKGYFNKVVGLDEAKKRGLLINYYVHKAPGAYIDGETKSSNRVASFVSRACGIKELMEKEKKALEIIDILDINNFSKLKRW